MFVTLILADYTFGMFHRPGDLGGFGSTDESDEDHAVNHQEGIPRFAPFERQWAQSHSRDLIVQTTSEGCFASYPVVYQTQSPVELLNYLLGEFNDCLVFGRAGTPQPDEFYQLVADMHRILTNQNAES